jgi:hypothetical protein
VLGKRKLDDIERQLEKIEEALDFLATVQSGTPEDFESVAKLQKID